MLIQCLGHSKFLLTLQSGYRIVTDPFDASTGYPVGDTEADAVLVSHHHSDHDAVDTVKACLEVFAPMITGMTATPIAMARPI